jgi:general secretion pathway protein E
VGTEGAGVADAGPRAASNVTDHLLARGLLTPAALARAQAVATETRERLDLVLTRLGLVGEADLVAAYAETLALQVATLADAPAQALLTIDLPERFLRHARLLPIADTEDGITLAMAHPDDALSLHAVRLKLRRPVHRRVAAASDVERMLDLLYAPAPTSADPTSPTTEHQHDDAERLRDLASDAPIVWRAICVAHDEQANFPGSALAFALCSPRAP